jgi:DsbC/DsbD-like thiol-disulfide interchange protein
MNGPTLRRLASTLLLAVTTVAVATMAGASAGGEAASAWTGDRRASVRLVGATPVGAAPFLVAGVEVRLADGWKTYWRYPGDSGVPPRFDFSGSVNVRAATVSWPGPMRFEEGGGTAIGYAGRVTFPVRVERDDPSRPVTLTLALDYAICEKLCVPATATTSLTLPAGGGETAEGRDVHAALARVPTRAALGQPGPLAIRTVTVEGAWPKPRIVVAVAAPPGTTPDLFAEGPTEAWALPVPEPAGAGLDGTRLFAFVVDGVPPGVDPRGTTVTLTAVAGDLAIEVPARLE